VKKKTISNILLFIGLLFVSACCFDGQTKRRFLKYTKNGEAIRALDLFPGDWETIHFVYGPACDYQIQELTGLVYSSDTCVQDDQRLILYAKDNIVFKTEKLCGERPWISFGIKGGYLKDRQAKFRIKIREKGRSFEQL